MKFLKKTSLLILVLSAVYACEKMEDNNLNLGKKSETNYRTHEDLDQTLQNIKADVREELIPMILNAPTEYDQSKEEHDGWPLLIDLYNRYDMTGEMSYSDIQDHPTITLELAIKGSDSLVEDIVILLI